MISAKGNVKAEVNVLVLTGFGLNCDHETAYAFELAGARSHRIHINALIDGDVKLDDFQILVFGGGFSWGDDHGAGVIQAARLKMNLGDKLLQFIEAGNLAIGICNGFQTLVNLGLLPGFDNCYTDRLVALTHNDCGNFRDQWVKLTVNPNSKCVFTQGVKEIELPVRHGEGKFYAENDIIKRLVDNNQVVLQYALPDGRPADLKFPDNPNGSLFDIAGICDSTGHVFGLMPHPEAFNHFTNHPNWTSQKEFIKRKLIAPEQIALTGNAIFENAVAYLS